MATTVSVDGDHASEPLPSTITENDGLNISSQSTEATPVIAESVLVSDGTVTEDKKWPGWPGHNAFRLIVPVLKVGSIIGRKGELVKKMSEETRARIRVLDGPVGTPDRIVLVFGKEEPESEMSPAMNAVIRIFKRVNGLSEADADSTTTAAATSSIRLLVASTQAIFLIGKQGTVIKSIQENSGASVRVLPEGDIPFYATPDERIVEIQGETLKVLKALEGVLGNLRRFLVDPSVIPLFEKSPHATAPQDRPSEHWSDKTQSLIHAASQTGIGSDYSLSMKREPLFLDREPPLESRLSLYGKDSSTPGFGRSAAALVTQVTQTMQIPLSYAEDIIGIGGANIGYIRRTSGAILTVQESRGLPDEITVEIKGTSSQVQTAQQLIQESISGRKEPIPSNYSKHDPGLGSYPPLSSSYTSSLPSQSYSGSSLTQSYGGYGSSGAGGYNSYRF